MTDENQLPANTCVYGRYDTLTLTPDTPETECRLRELGWTNDDFRDRTVLDIGCNSGILSVFALQLGARHIKAVDPTKASIETFAKVLQRHRGLNVTLECADLGKLDPAENRADVVLFMEVMHWAIDQGMTIPDVIRRLWQMTGTLLFLEFPWSVHEPSIQAQTKLTEDTYSASLILEELGKAFASVKIVNFMHYFGILGTAKRVLIRATEPRPEFIITSKRANTFSVFTLGERSSNYIAPMISQGGMQLFKQYSPHSAFSQLPIELANQLISGIVAANPACLIAPIEIEGTYIFDRLGVRSSVYPLVARQRINLAEFGSVRDHELMAAAIRLRRDLRDLTIEPALRTEESLRRGPSAIGVSFDLSAITGRTTPDPVLEDMLAIGLDNYDFEANEICHCDLQEGNVIVGTDGSMHVIDLDGLAFGTAFTDGLCAMIWAGAAAESFEALVTELEREERCQITTIDCGIALIILAHWFQAVLQVDTAEARANVQRARSGLSNLVAWWERHEALGVPG
jgi:SAM-dependent methyltransferase